MVRSYILQGSDQQLRCEEGTEHIVKYLSGKSATAAKTTYGRIEHHLQTRTPDPRSLVRAASSRRVSQVSHGEGRLSPLKRGDHIISRKINSNPDVYWPHS